MYSSGDKAILKRDNQVNAFAVCSLRRQAINYVIGYAE